MLPVLACLQVGSGEAARNKGAVTSNELIAVKFAASIRLRGLVANPCAIQAAVTDSSTRGHCLYCHLAMHGDTVHHQSQRVHACISRLTQFLDS